MERSYSQDLEPKVSWEAKVILILKQKFYKEVPWEICYSIESSQSSKARTFSSSRKSNSRFEGNNMSNSQYNFFPKDDFGWVSHGCLKITGCSENNFKVGKQGKTWDSGNTGNNATWDHFN
jgi:hypothetical protein